MTKQLQERRRCRIYSPYLFFGFELVIYGELAYLIDSIVGESQTSLIAIALIVGYQLPKSIKRLVSIKQRCKSVEIYHRYRKKAQEKQLKNNISF